MVLHNFYGIVNLASFPLVLMELFEKAQILTALEI